MSIVVIKGPAKTGKSLVANALRNNHINQKKGVLLIDETQEGDVKAQIEKLLVGIVLPESVPSNLKDLPWKPDPMIIVVNSKISILEAFEKLVPGFKVFFGPVYTIDTGRKK